MSILKIPVVGLPNVGKSTLINALMGHKVSIVTHKPHTTRTLNYFKKTSDEIELVFMDTPGIDRVKTKLGSVIFQNMQKFLKNTEKMILVLDSSNPCIDLFLPYISKSIVILNKIDYLRKFKLLPILEQLKNLGAQNVFCVCAKTGDGVSELLDYLKTQTIFEDINLNSLDFTNQEVEAINYACECVREKILLSLDKEIPYKILIVPVKYNIPKESAWNIYLDIIVPKKIYKSILIGKEASNLKSIGQAARIEIALRQKQPGFLGLNVILDEKLWERKETYLSLGWKV